MGWILTIGGFLLGVWLLQMLLWWVGALFGRYTGCLLIILLILIGVGVHASTGSILSAVLVPILAWFLLAITGNGLGEGAKAREQFTMGKHIRESAQLQMESRSLNDWVTYTSEQHGFTVRFPYEPSVNFNEPNALKPVANTFYSASSDDHSLYVWIDVSERQDNDDIYKILQRKLSIAEATGGWSEMGTNTFSFQGMQALVGKAFDASGAAGSYYFDLVAIGDYVYCFHVSSANEEYARKTFTTLSDSFSISETAQMNDYRLLTAQPPPHLCDYCNTLLESGQQFCHECGREVVCNA
jgi:hypothetical protein